MSLKIWLPLNGNLNDNVNQVTATASAAVTYGTGKVTNQSFSGGSTYIKFPWEDNQTNAFSIVMWVKPNSPAAWQDIFSFGSGNNRIEVDNTLTQYRWYANENALITSGTTLFSLPNEQWNHIAMTLNGSTVYFYLNGVLVQTMTQACTFATALGDLNELRLCCRTTTGTSLWKGFINDVRVYDHCLSPREVKQIAHGLVLHYPLNNSNNTNMLSKSHTMGDRANAIDSVFGFPFLSVTNTSTSSYKDFASWGGFTVNANETYTVSFYAKSDTKSTLTMYFYNNAQNIVQVLNIKSSEGHNKSGTDGNCPLTLTQQWKKYWVTWKFNTTTTSAAKTLLFRLGAGGQCDVALPKLEKGAIATPYGLKADEVASPLIEPDCSGFGNFANRSKVFDYVSNTDGRYSNATHFSGGNYIKNNNTFLTEGWADFTMSAWINPSSYHSERSCIIIGGMYLTLNNAGKISTYCYGKSPEGYHDGRTTIPLNTWTHVAAVWDSINKYHKIYVNGVEDLSISCTGAANANFATKKEIGAESDGTSRHFNGLIADVRIYATALRANDITTLYNSSIAMLENGGMQAYEFVEEPDVFNIKMQKTGTLKSADISEVGYIGGMKTEILPDRTVWARIHWLDVTTTKQWFTDDETACCNKFNRFSRMCSVEHFKNSSGKYEFMLTYPSIQKTLPSEYTKLDYIEATGTQWINTGVTGHARWEFDIQFTNTTKRQLMGYFGNGDEYWGTQTDGKYGLFAGSTIGKSGGRDTIVHDYMSGAATLWVEGSTLGVGGNTSLGSNQYQLFNIMSTYDYTCHAKMWRCKCVQNGQLIRDFVPALRKSDGYIGLFDIVNNVFYGNSGSGNFITGNIPQNQQIELYNRWLQTSSPNDGAVAGFKPITTAWSAHNFGIRKNGSACVYNCDSGGTWYAPIGQKTRWTDTLDIPAADGSSQTQTELWVRIDNLSKLNKISMLNEEYLQALNIYEN